MQAARWARDRFSEWGLANPHLEPFEFGRGWQLEHVSVAMTEPRYVPLIAYADAWSPSTAGVVSGRAVYVGDKTAAQIQAMAGQLRGAIVLTHLPLTEFVVRDRPQPGLDDDPVATGNPPLPQARSTTPAGELATLLATGGRGGRVAAERVPRRHGGCDGESRDSHRRCAVDRRSPVNSTTCWPVWPPRVVPWRCASNCGRATSRRTATATTSSPRSRGRIRRCATRSCSSARTSTRGTRRVAPPTTPTAQSRSMEAMRIIRALGAGPRRTIRVALWSGEEQGLLGARAYVAQHFATPAARNQLAVYLNDDPGSGRTLGFYMEGNTQAKALFDRWLAPLQDLGATRNVIEGIGSTDHVPFNEAGLPGFNVIKDFGAYDERTRHTNADYPERMSDDALKQSAIVMATFAWQAATMEGTIPRGAGK